MRTPRSESAASRRWSSDGELLGRGVRKRAEAAEQQKGEITGTPVLLVHGFPESWWGFRGVIPVLSAEHRVIVVDLPGFGLEMLADVTHGGTWHIGVMAAPGIAELLLTGRSARSWPTTPSPR